jgi:hypothetical protein
MKNPEKTIGALIDKANVSFIGSVDAGRTVSYDIMR